MERCGEAPRCLCGDATSHPPVTCTLSTETHWGGGGGAGGRRAAGQRPQDVLSHAARLGSRSSRSDHFLSPEPDTDSSQHPGCGARPAHGPRPPRPRLPREGLRTAQHRLGQCGRVGGTRGQSAVAAGGAHLSYCKGELRMPSS